MTTTRKMKCDHMTMPPVAKVFVKEAGSEVVPAAAVTSTFASTFTFTSVRTSTSIATRCWRHLTHCLFLLLTCLSLPASAGEEYLDPEAAFRFSAVMKDARTVAVTYQIADGYYMYRERFQFAAEGAMIGVPVFPNGKIKFDTTFQKNLETYRHAVTIDLPVQTSGRFTLSVTGQGCADAGLCYSPMTSKVGLSPAGGGGLTAALQATLPASSSVRSPAFDMSVQRSDAVPVEKSAGRSATDTRTTDRIADQNPTATAATGATVKRVATPAATTVPAAVVAQDDNNRIATALRSGQLSLIVPLFLLLGLGLSFTPCVLPMVPILSSIIVGEGADVSRQRGFLLSVAYAMGMAIVYTALGVAAGLLGEGLAAILQNPWVLGAFALLMVGLSLSMFGVYDLQVPGALQSRLTKASQRLPAGRMVGVFLMGALSALIVGPCVAAPLAGALVYISQTRDVFIGGSALFAMAIGMSVPLLLVGLSAGTLLPRAGVWMDVVKRVFGILMLAVAWWLVAPVLPAAVVMIGWAALGLGAGAWLLWAAAVGWPGKAVGVAVTALGLLQLIGVASGGRDPLAPLAHLHGTPPAELRFARIKSEAQLDAILANTGGKTVMLDFYADWCVSCKEMEKFTFSDGAIQRQLANTILLQADVTANDSNDRALLKRFGLFGPPGIILFDRQGKEIRDSRIIGYQNAKRFGQSLTRLTPA